MRLLLIICHALLILTPTLLAQTNTFESYYNQGMEKLQNEDFRRAIVDFTIALDIEERIEAYISRAKAKQFMDDLEGALQDYEEAIRINSSDAVLYNNQGNLHDKLLNPQEAIISYNKALSLDSTYTNAFFNRAIAFYNIRSYENAKEDFQKVVQLDDEDSEAWVGLGLSLYKLGDKDQACISFQKAQKLDIRVAREYVSKYCQ